MHRSKMLSGAGLWKDEEQAKKEMSDLLFGILLVGTIGFIVLVALRMDEMSKGGKGKK